MPETETPLAAPAVVDLSSDCTCAYCPECEAGFDAGPESDPCPDCGNDGDPSQYCNDCWEFPADMFAELWDQTIGEEPHKVTFASVTWAGRSGVVVEDDVVHGEVALARFTLDSSWRLKAEFSENRVGITRWSHDEPTGALFVIETLGESKRELFAALLDDVDYGSSDYDRDLVEAFDAAQAFA